MEIGGPEGRRPSTGARDPYLTRALVAVAVFLASIYTALFSAGTQGVKAVFGHFAVDAFYYLVIAQNAAEGLFSTYDTETVTNSYHPLWQLILNRVLSLWPASQPVQLLAVFWLSAVLVGLGTALAALGIHRRTGSPYLALWLVPGLFHVLFRIAPISTGDLGVTYTYSTWAFINGVESPLSILFAGWLLYVLLSPASGRPTLIGGPNANKTLAIGVLAGLIVLTRLDDVFLLVGLFSLAVWRRGSTRRAVTDTALACGPGAVGLLVYVAFNKLTVGVALPISGQLKSGFHLMENLSVLTGDFFPFLAASTAYSPERWMFTMARTVPILIPAMVAVGALFLLRRHATANGESDQSAWLRLLFPLLIYVVLKAAYNMAFVTLMAQGYWYHAVSVFVVNVVLVLALGQLWPKRKRWDKALAAVWLLVFLVTSATALHRIGEPNWRFDVWKRRGQLRAALHAIETEPKIVGCGDGLFAYLLRVPSMSVTGLTTGREGREALEAGTYPAYCIHRGFDIGVWLPGIAGMPFLTREQRKIDPRLEMLHRDEETGVTFSRLR